MFFKDYSERNVAAIVDGDKTVKIVSFMPPLDYSKDLLFISLKFNIFYGRFSLYDIFVFRFQENYQA